MSGKAPRKSDAVKVKRKAFGVVNANAPYPSMQQYASKKELAAFQKELDSFLEALGAASDPTTTKKSNPDC
jgi:hypothetical protein